MDTKPCTVYRHLHSDSNSLKPPGLRTASRLKRFEERERRGYSKIESLDRLLKPVVKYVQRHEVNTNNEVRILLTSSRLNTTCTC